MSTLKDLLKNKQIVIGGTIILILIAIAVLAPVLTGGRDYASMELKNKLLAPGGE